MTTSDIVHHVVYTSSGMGFQCLCNMPWAVANATYHVRVVTETGSVGRSTTLTLTRDFVDCMACLVAYGRGCR